GHTVPAELQAGLEGATEVRFLYVKSAPVLAPFRRDFGCHFIALQHLFPVPFFFEGAPQLPGQSSGVGKVPSPAYVFDFLATTDGLALTKPPTICGRVTVRAMEIILNCWHCYQQYI